MGIDTDYEHDRTVFEYKFEKSTVLKIKLPKLYYIYV